jgi:hypothetical protein
LWDPFRERRERKMARIHEETEERVMRKINNAIDQALESEDPMQHILNWLTRNSTEEAKRAGVIPTPNLNVWCRYLKLAIAVEEHLPSDREQKRLTFMRELLADFQNRLDLAKE